MTGGECGLAGRDAWVGEKLGAYVNGLRGDGPLAGGESGEVGADEVAGSRPGSRSEEDGGGSGAALACVRITRIYDHMLTTTYDLWSSSFILSCFPKTMMRRDDHMTGGRYFSHEVVVNT
jgi:hypothetical protein